WAELSVHRLRQEQRDLRVDQEQPQDRDIGEDERGHSLEYLLQGDLVPYHGLDDEHVHADRRRDQADLDQLDHDYTEPHQVVTERIDDRRRERQREQQDAVGVEERSKYQVQDADGEQDLEWSQAMVQRPIDRVARYSSQPDERHQQLRIDGDGEDQGGLVGRLHQRIENAGEIEPLQDQTQAERDRGRHRRGLGRGQHPEIDSTDDDNGDQQNGPYPRRRCNLLARAGLRSMHRCGGRLQPAPHEDDDNVRKDAEHARYDARDEQHAD